MIDLVALSADAYIKHEEDKDAQKAYFCTLFLEELKKMEGEDLAPHLSGMIFDTKTGVTTLSLLF